MTKKHFSRRLVIAGLMSARASAIYAATPDNTTDFQATSPDGNLPSGVVVRDFRIFPSPDTTRFLVEVQNNSESTIDTPAIGVTIPHLNVEDNYGWAVPFQGVLHQGTSAGLIGIAPPAIRSNDDWGQPEWSMCDDIQSIHSEYISQWSVAFDHTITVQTPTSAMIDVAVTNTGSPLPSNVTLSGLVRDADKRIAGGTVSIYLNSIAPGETRILQVPLQSDLEYAANPMQLIDTSEEFSVEFSLQPFQPVEISPGCSPVMPWNR